MFIDTHCHLDLTEFDEDREKVLARAREVNVRLIVNPGIDLHHSRQAIALAEAHEGVYAAVGVHPNSSADFDQTTIEALRELAAHPKVVAIGEIGLDYYWDAVPIEKQADAFRQQLALAEKVGLPVIIHSRNAKPKNVKFANRASCNEDVATILEEWVSADSFQGSPLAARPYAGVLHAFGGDLALAERAYGWNFVLSLGGPVTFKNAHNLHELVPQLQPDRLMLETDAPYLTPHPHRGKRNESSYIPLICKALANLFGISAEQMESNSTSLALRFFGLEQLSHVEFTTSDNVYA